MTPTVYSTLARRTTGSIRQIQSARLSTLSRLQSAVPTDHSVEVKPAPTQQTSAQVSYQASRWAPTATVPLQDGTGSDIDASLVSGAPADLQSRVVRIYQPAKPATQSGHSHGQGWRIDFDILTKGHRWENSLIGYQSTGDVVQGERLLFNSKEDAIRFATRQGYQYQVQEPHQRKFVPKAYAEQFAYSAGKLKQVRTK